MTLTGRATWLALGGCAVIGALLALRVFQADRGPTAVAPWPEGAIEGDGARRRVDGRPTTRLPSRPVQRIRVVAPKPRDADTWFNRGMSLLNAGSYEEAIDAFQQATSLEPDWARAHHNLGYAYEKAGRYADAVASYKVAVLLDPKEPETHNNLGSAYVKLDRYEEAVGEFQQAIGLNPDHAEAYLNLGIAQLLLRRPDGARQTHEALARLDPDMAQELWGLIQQSEP